MVGKREELEDILSKLRQVEISRRQGMIIAASTDEGSHWFVSGSMDLGGGASVIADVNYTED